MIFLLFVLILGISCVKCNECSLYLAPSLLRNFGNGVFAGKSFSINTTVETGVTVLFGEDLFSGTQIENYAYASHDPRCAVCVLGAGMMFNHQETPNLDTKFEGPSSDIQVANIRPYSTYNNKQYIANRDISVGEELFSRYGDSQWFSERDIPYNQTLSPSQTYSLEELAQIGHCLSDVSVQDSHLPLAGRGLFAARDFSAGELVTLSPALLLSRRAIEAEGVTSLLQNYLISAEGSDMAVLPFGLAALCNHGGPNTSTLSLQWAKDLQGTPLSSHELPLPHRAVSPKGGSVYLSYVARRPLKRGEELTIDYGPTWQWEWTRYVHVLQQWLSVYGEKGSSVTRAPQFRHVMGAPVGLFPPSWMTPCLSPPCLSQHPKRPSRPPLSVDRELEKIRASREALGGLRRRPDWLRQVLEVLGWR